MTIKEAIEIARRAFEADEVAEYLSGQKNYSKPINRYVGVDVPTDFEYIVRIGIHEYYDETQKSEIPEKYKSALLKLAEGDCVSVWCAYMVAHLQYYYEKSDKSPFTIITQDFVETLSSALYKNKESLMNCHLYTGKNEENGLWQDIERIDNIYAEKYGVSFL